MADESQNSILDEENFVAEEVQDFIAKSSVTDQRIIAFMQNLAKRHDRLLKRHKRIVRIGDLQHEQMKLTNLTLNEFSHQLRGRFERAQELITEQTAQLKETSRLATLGEVAGGVAHDINNPITVIYHKAQILRQRVHAGTVQSEEILKSLESIIKMTQRISGIVRAVKSVARDGTEDPFEVTSLAEIIADAAQVCEFKFSRSDIELKISDVHDFDIECKPTLIFQTILNLLNNAHDAVEDLEVKWVNLDIEDIGSHVRISVTDSGSGISREEKERIMRRLVTTKSRQRGTGLGLSIIKRAVSAHNGRFDVDHDSPNTRFIVELPKSQSRQSHQTG